MPQWREWFLIWDTSRDESSKEEVTRIRAVCGEKQTRLRCTVSVQYTLEKKQSMHSHGASSGSPSCLGNTPRRALRLRQFSGSKL